MKRIHKITALSLMAVLVCAATVWAAINHKISYKYRLRGVTATLQETHTNNYGSCFSHEAKLVDSKNKTIFSWPKATYGKPHKSVRNNGVYTSVWNYKFSTFKMAPGKYRFITKCYNGNKTYAINYAGQSVINYRKTKAIRQNNGDLVQRFYLSRNRLNNKVIHVQIFNSKNKLVYSLNRKSNNSNQDFTFNWNGWPNGTSVNKCPKGVYTLKYWADGVNPKTVRFRLAL